MTVSDRIRARAVELGFDHVGIAPAGPAPRADAFLAWLARGYQAGMDWLARQPDRRIHPDRVLPGAHSIVAVGLSYFVGDPDPRLWDDPSRGRIARYAWGPDYHRRMTPPLRELSAFVERETGAPARAYVDTGPVLERAAAAAAGLGFIGKNTLLIDPASGSYLFLAVVLSAADLEPDPPAAAGTCGGCRRCLQACPSGALVAPYLLDSNRCIAYLTIELKGPIPEPLRPRLGNWIFGCDECQSACPWVRRYAAPKTHPFLRYQPDQCVPRLLDLINLDEAAFRARFRGTPLQRAKRRGLLRNVAVALGNWGHPDAAPALEKALADPEPLVREHARWALDRIAS